MIKNDANGQFNLTKEIFDWIESIAVSIVIVVLLFTFIFRMVWVQGHSMENTLQDNDRVIISSLGYEPKQYDIVVVNAENEKMLAERPDLKGKPFIKRIIATEGQTIDFNREKGQVIVDGKVLDEWYIKEAMTEFGDKPDMFPLTVKKDQVFVMGDNRNDSYDSRYELIGTIDKHKIIGKVIIRVFPFNKIGNVDKYTK